MFLPHVLSQKSFSTITAHEIRFFFAIIFHMSIQIRFVLVAFVTIMIGARQFRWICRVGIRVVFEN